MEKKGFKKSLLADLSLLVVAFVWGGGFVAVKDALNTLSPMLLMAFRFTIASAIIYVFFRKKIGAITKGDLKGGSVVGLMLFAAFALQTIGLQYTTASKQGFLTAIYVVFVPLLYWLFYRKAPARKVFIASSLAIVGIGLISLNSGFSVNLGDGLTLGCAVFFALHILSIEYFSKDMNGFKLAFLQMAVAAVLCIAMALLTEPVRLALNQREWTAVLYLAVFSTFACFTIQTVAQRYTSSAHASLIMSLESVFAALLGVLLLGEVMTVKIVIGSVLVFAAILLIEVNWSKKKTIEEHS